MRRLRIWLLALSALMSHAAVAEVMNVKLHYVGPTEGSAWMGANQGIEEANHQGEFLGQHYTLEPISMQDLDGVESLTAILVAGSEQDVSSIAKNSQFAHVPVMNIVSDSDALRRACLPNLLNLSVSNKMKQDALGQWLAKHPDSKAQAQSWHEDFKKFAASQLNKRFKKSHGVVMDDDGWSGWAAVKLLSDTVARTQASDAATMLNYLKNDIAFDGQKGAGSTFRDTGQLRQLLLIVEDNKIVAEAPLRGVKGGLDSLGLKSCK